MQPPEIDLNKLNDIVKRHKKGKWELIPLLQDVQETYGYVPPETIDPIAEALNLFSSQVQGVITFYSGFSLKPKGKYVCKVCRGTACHVRGGPDIIKAIEQVLGIEQNQTTEDMRYTFETVACLGTCFLAPVIMVNNDYYGHLSSGKIKNILEKYA